jgi:hypothetical protein
MGEKQTQPFQLSFKSTLTVDLADRPERSRGESSFRCKKLQASHGVRHASHRGKHA